MYRATDTRLDRTVAIKVLPEHLASDPQRRERFEREARAVSSLNHPHICTLHDVGEQDGVHYLVMELVEGDTLQQRLEKGRLPLDQALEYAIQIADALDKAHRQGVVHRDLKPGNIMITKSGTKLLDFGLAKLKGDAGGVSPLSQMPTQDASAPLTAEGTIIGTLQYMAPEQLEDKEADARTDIFAFGAVVYEMVTGKKAFEGASQAGLISAIMQSEPRPMKELQSLSPPRLDRLVETCLAKHPDDRWQNAADLTREMRWLAAGDSESETSVPAPAPESRVSVRSAAAMLAAFVAGGAVAGLAAWVFVLTSAPITQPVSRSVIALEPERLALPAVLPAGIAQPSLAWSPDGDSLVYVIDRNGESQLHLRRLDAFTSTPLEGTDGGFAPFFSPDGQWVAFFTPTELKKIPINGGNPQTLSAATNVRGGSWGLDDKIVFTESEGVQLSRVSAHGGDPEVVRLQDLSQDEGLFLWPRILPDGQHVLVTINGAFSTRIAVLSLETGGKVELVDRGYGAQYTTTGHLVYGIDGSVVAAPFDLSTLTVTDTGVQILPGVRQDPTLPQLAFSESGRLAYVPGDDMSLNTPVWVDRRTREERSIPALPMQRYKSFRLSPEGDRLAISVAGATTDVFFYDFERATGLTNLTVAGNNLLPVWNPDGRAVIYQTDNVGPEQAALTGLFVQPIAGGTSERLVLADTNMQAPWPESWSETGMLAFTASGTGTATDVWTLSLDNPAEPQPFKGTPASEWGAAFSPDGNFVAYTSDETGQYAVYVEPFPPTGDRWPVSTGYGEEPLWSAAGDELFYRRGHQWLSVPVVATPEFDWGIEEVVFEGRYVNPFGVSYAVAPDADRFLVLKQREQPEPIHINLVHNWFDELNQLVPTSNQQ